MNAIAQGLDYARVTGDSILQLLGMQNDKLDALLNKPEPKKLSKLDVIAEGLLDTYPLAELAMVPIIENNQGVYLRINHWAAEMEAAGTVRLYYGYSNTEAIGILDAFANNVTAFYFAKDPNELILPPGAVLFAKATKPGVVTIAATRYLLSV